jgi:23S rRNA (guanosine2251-2'-O)-methyltransferase
MYSAGNCFSILAWFVDSFLRFYSLSYFIISGVGNYFPTLRCFSQSRNAGPTALKSICMRKLSHAEISTNRVPEEQVAHTQRIPLTVLVDSIRSLYNVGSIFRTSDGAMIENLILAGFTPHPPRKEIEKTALGSTKSVPWEYSRHPLEPILNLKERGYKICCLELTDKSIPYNTITKEDFPLCLVIGNEIRGVSEEVITHCDMAIEIPMYGIKQSLNVAVAYGIAVFELARLWRTK